ncbi:metal cation symporter ZIP14-like isoform X2 [Penaeus japonicus]|uniref:metal cation symporter ZIP14-like isoform X2 n=1 Tax=Penaeus japonicus TaxID=27405 RepID=UPI001C70FA7E|nr:metal cation symporter ZIP14-like isoform X2 [Penaeus japonicus]
MNIKMLLIGKTPKAVVSGLICLLLHSAVATEETLTNHWSADWGPPPTNPADFTNFLWYGFSANKVNFTQDDLKRLLDCTTGKKVCPPLSKEPPVSILSNCKINEALSPAQCSALKECSTGLGQEEDSNLGVEELRALLPEVLYLSQHRDHCEGGTTKPVKTKPRPAEVWGYGLLFVTLISGCSLVGVSVLPLMAHTFYQQLLTLLVGLAVGSLAASSLFHLIPQAFEINAMDDGHHSYLFISLFVLLGIWGFFMVERIIKITVTHQASKQEQSKFPISASDQVILCENGGCELQCNNMKNGDVKNHKPSGPVKSESFESADAIPSSKVCSSRDVELIYASQEQAIKASFGHNERPHAQGHNHNIEFRQGKDSVIKTVAWMIIFGDGFHNFIDGVSIGAAFSESILTGISISLAVMCEELPHELGDFAVLLNAGMTMKQAVAYNFLSATTCYLGLVLGIVLGEFTQNSTAIFALAAGMFLYIALVDMVPEMNEVAGKAAEGSWKSAVCILFLQNVGIFLGIASLFLLAYFQDSLIIT